MDFYYYAAIYRLRMSEEKFMKSTIRQIEALIKLDRNYEKSILFDVINAMHQKPKEREIDSLLDL